MTTRLYADPVRTPRRATAAVALALVPLGTIAGHVAGYAMAGDQASSRGSHAHLRPAAWVTALLAALALGWIAGGRGTATRPRLAWLSGGQAASFVLLEVGEHLLGGDSIGHLVGDPAFRWGLAAQAAAAGVLVLAAVAAAVTGEKVRAVLAARLRLAQGSDPPPPPCRTEALRSLATVSRATERGPPPFLAIG